MTPSPVHWRLLTTPAASGAENMALDEALMQHARDTGEWTLRVYTWSEPTVSFGRNQTALGRYDADRIRERGLRVVRRPTGGRAILHDREITYSVTAPGEAAGDLRQSYERINTLLTAALRQIGVDAEIAQPVKRAAVPGIAPCFNEPSAGELTVGGRKLAGSAQWRCDGALLQHGSILIDDDQSVLPSLVSGGQAAIPAPATLASALGRRPTAAELADALAAAVRAIEDPAAEPMEIDPDLRARTDALVVRYLDDGWTWRR